MLKAVNSDLATPVLTLSERVSDEDAQTKSNVKYAIGRLVERSGNEKFSMDTS